MIKKLYSYFNTCNSISTDTRKISKKSLFFALKGEHFNANKFALEALNKGAKFAVIDEPKYKLDDRFILVDNVLIALQQLATYHREELALPIIALTGSNGKTTTKELINAVLATTFKTVATKGNLNNHIGVPLTLLSMTKQTEIGIVEMGANHPKEIAFLCNIAKPNYGYITNFGKAHLEGFKNLEGVIKAKTELYNYLKENNKKAFVNDNDAIQILKSRKLKTIHFGEKKSIYNIYYNGANPYVQTVYNGNIIKSKLIGSYNYNNIAAAVAIGLYFKVEIKKIKNGIENYLPENNRSQIIKKGTNNIILDAYNANPSSMQSAIANFKQLKDKTKIVILGDMFELGKHAKKEHQIIVDLLIKTTFDTIYLLGENFYKTNANSTIVSKFKTFENFKNNFKTPKNTTLLIKGSRGMALERVLELL